MIKVALAGNPNCGKTTLFNALTGSTAHVGNWPGVTVDKREGKYKKGSEEVDIVDLPGIYSLSPYTPEEVISRNYIIDEKPDCVVNIVDATNLERNLYLTTQILEMDVPVVVALNMADVLKKSNEVIDVKKLSDALGVKVVLVSALTGEGLDELMKETIESAKKDRVGTSIVLNTELKDLALKVKSALEEESLSNSLYHAMKLIEDDEIELKAHPREYEIVKEAKEDFKNDTFGTDFEAIIADARYKYIQENYSTALIKPTAQKTEKVKKGNKEVEYITVVDKNGNEKKKKVKQGTKSDRIDKVLTNRVFGLIIFAAILFLVFHLTFGEDLFYLGAMGAFSGIEAAPWAEGTAWEGIIWTGESIQAPGVFLQTCLVGLTDWFTELVGGWLEAGNASAWASAFICDGILAGIFSVLSFLPQILLLFLFFAILEDSGYMARVAFILDRIFRKFGVTGRAFMPMIMGFGCSIPAMVNTRTLATDKERTATIRVIPFFSCSAKLPILTACAGAIVSQMGVGNADLITFGMYLTGVAVAIIALLVLRNTTMRGETPPFIMELPAYHWPKFSALMLHVWDKCKHFVKKAFTIILVSNIIIWFLQSFTPYLQYIEYSEDDGFLTEVTTNDSILANLGRTVQFIFTPLGFGSQLGAYGWVFAVGAITGLIAKENVIATFAMLGAVVGATVTDIPDIEGATDVARMIAATGINTPGVLAFIVFNMTTIPCFAAVATAKAELKPGTLKNTIGFWLITSYVAASAFYIIGTWWWTCFIYIAAIVVGIIVIHNVNKSKDKKLEEAAA